MKHHANEADFRAALPPGDERLLPALIDRLFPSIAAYLKKMGASLHDAEDVFYIAIEVLWEKGRASGYEPGFNFYAFLLQVCKNQWYNILRRKKKRGHTVTPEALTVLNPDASIQELLEIVEFRNTLLAYIDALGEPCRQLLLLWAEGYSFEEIAEKMGYKTAESARQQKYKCMERLKKIIGGDGFND